MSDLELILDTEKIPLSFGMKIDNVKNLLSHHEMTLDAIPNDSRSYLIFDKDGFSISFNDSELSTVFLYLPKTGSSNLPFIGNENHLPRSFFSNPSENDFITILESQGFNLFWKKYPNAIDMVKEKIRIRYTNRKDTAYISINDGSILPQQS